MRTNSLSALTPKYSNAAPRRARTPTRPNRAFTATAPMASWQALYCVTAPPASQSRPDSGMLRLYGIRDSSMFLDAANYRLQPPFSGGHHVWRPVPGHMAVFSASILHEVALNRTEANLLLVSARVRFAHAAQTAAPPW